MGGHCALVKLPLGVSALDKPSHKFRSRFLCRLFLYGDQFTKFNTLVTKNGPGFILKRHIVAVYCPYRLYLKLQRQMFRKSEKDLSKEEYQRLVQAAHEKGDLRMELILETICATGIRVGELKYITVEAVRAGVAEIALKGKIRTILLPHRLCRKLQKYAKQQKIASGKIFLTQDGLPVSRQSIWTRMKALCEAAGVERSKAFPHNLRSLFARSFYGSCHDVVRLADVLGHSSIETTRIYLMSTGKEYLRQLDKLGLV